MDGSERVKTVFLFILYPWQHLAQCYGLLDVCPPKLGRKRALG